MSVAYCAKYILLCAINLVVVVVCCICRVCRVCGGMQGLWWYAGFARVCWVCRVCGDMQGLRWCAGLLGYVACMGLQGLAGFAVI